MRFFIFFAFLFFINLSFAEHSYVTKDGKNRYSVEYTFDGDKIDMKAKKQYLPAVTDGKIIDHPPKKSFKIPPSAKKMASKFGKGINLALAVDLLFDGIDYVMDPTNNSVTVPPQGIYIAVRGQRFNNLDAAANYNCSVKDDCVSVADVTWDAKQKFYRVYGFNSDGKKVPAWAVNVEQDKESEVLTDEQIAERIIQLAKQGNKAAQDIVIESVKQDVENGEYDDILFEVTKEGVDPDTDTKTETDPDTDQDKDKDKEKEKKKEKSEDLPPFCSWAKFLCDDRVSDNSSPIDVQDDVLDFKPMAEKSYISLPKTCPRNPNISFNLPFVDRVESLEFPLDKFCEAFALFKIVVILFAYIKALAIVGSGL